MIKNKIYSNVIMQDLETLEKIENQLNSLTLEKLLKRQLVLKRNKLKRKHYLKRFQMMKPQWKK